LKTLKAGDLMVTLDQCPRVSEEAVLRDAVLALEESRLRGDPWDYRPRVVLIQDKNNNVVGVLRQFEILKALEPKYNELLKNLDAKYTPAMRMLDANMKSLDEMKILFCLGLSPGFVKSSLNEFHLWDEALGEMSRRASSVKVTKIMSALGEHDLIEQDAPLSEAVHRMLMGNLLSLVVVEDGRSLGILRIIDIFNEACSAIKLSEV
jgi:hypothetical protein